MLIFYFFLFILDKKMLGSFNSQRTVTIGTSKSEFQFGLIACTI
jgi:hypothetical protein